MNRYPAGTGYVGPTANYDEQITPDQLLRRLVYGIAAPMLRPSQRPTMQFYGHLLEELSNAHAVIVKACASRAAAHYNVRLLREELPSDLFVVQVLHAPERGEWLVMAYNRITKAAMKPPKQFVPYGAVWVDMEQVARILGVTRRQAINIALKSGVITQRRTGRNTLYVMQRDLPILANRARRWERRPTAARKADAAAKAEREKTG